MRQKKLTIIIFIPDDHYQRFILTTITIVALIKMSQISLQSDVGGPSKVTKDLVYTEPKGGSMTGTVNNNNGA